MKPQRNQKGNVFVFILLGILILLSAWMYRQHLNQQNAEKKIAAQKILYAQQQESERLEILRKKQEELQAENEKQQQAQQLLERQAQVKRDEQDQLKSSLAKLDALKLKWEDALKIATATGRIALANPVSNLQAIQRETQSLVLPPCIDSAKAKLNESMELQIESFLIFMRNELNLGDIRAQEPMKKAATAIENYKQLRESSCQTNQ